MSKNSVVTNAEILGLLSQGEGLKRFYRFTAQNNHIVLHDACQIVIKRPAASVCFSFEEWNSMGRRIKQGTKAIRYIDDDGYLQYVFDANDTYGDGRYRRLIYPMKRLLGGLDELNGKQTSEKDFKDDYSQIYSGVQNYLKANGYYSENGQRNTLLTEGIAYSLYSTTGFPKSAGIEIHGLPYSLQENSELFKEVYTTAAILQQEIEYAYIAKQNRVQIIDDVDEESVSDEPKITGSQQQTSAKEVPVKNPELEIREKPNIEEPPTVSPLYQKYLDSQKLQPTAVVLMRLGDFYEIMGENAVKVSKELDITLTGRDVGLKERVPMCGMPYHAMDKYLDKILEKHGVLLVDNDEEPKYILSYAEVRGQKKPEERKNPILEEITGNEPTPFDEEQPDYVGEIDTRFPIEDDYESDEEYDEYDVADADEWEDDPEDLSDGEEPELKKPAPKNNKPIKDRKRKQKPQPSLFDYFLPEEKSPKEKLIEYDLKRGCVFKGVKVRIYDKYQENPTIDEFAAFLKKEYGTGDYYSNYNYKQIHDAKGIELKYIDNDNADNSILVKLKWSEVATRIADLIDDGEYFSDKEKEQYAEIQRRRAERINAKTDEERLMVIARQAITDGTGNTLIGKYEIQPYKFEESAQFLREHKPEFEKVLLREREIKAIHPTAFPYADNTIVEFYPQFCPRMEHDETPEQATEQNSENSDDVKIGDKFVYRGKTMTVTGLQGIYPNDVVCSYNDSAGGKTYTATLNVDRSDLINNGTKLREIVFDLTPKEIEESRAPAAHTDLNEIGFDQTELGGAKSRYRNNVRAIELCKELYARNRVPTPEEKKILASYVGWGGLPQVFDEHKSDWSKEYSELKRVLNADDYDRAKGSVLNSHYTSKEVIDGIYSALKRFGVKGNNRILEPAMGTGNFFGFMPQEISDGAKLYGVELDTITGRIASKLYPQAKIQIKGYEETSFENNSFDIVVGNVPFGGYTVYDSEYAKNNFYIHDYFLAKSIDKLKPKGLMAVITSKGTMDKLNPSVRRYLASRAELLGAIRLPNTAFQKNAGTRVVADILFFRKREEQINPTNENTEWLSTGKTEDGYEINNYFINHPEMVLGKFTKENRLYGAEEISVAPDDRELSQALSEAISTLPENFYENPDHAEDFDDSVEAYNVKPLCFKADNGRLYVRVGNKLEEVPIPKSPKDAYNRIKEMIALREELHKVLDMQIHGCKDEELQAEQRNLNYQYNRFVKYYGILNSQTNTKLFKDDGDSALLFACENLSDDKKSATKADIFFKRTIRPYIVPTQTDDCLEALQISQNERGAVDISYIEELTRKDYDTVITELGNAVFRNPLKVIPEDKYSGFETSEEYLSGKVVQKLNTARYYAEHFPEMGYERNVQALETVQPSPVKADEIAARLGASWIDKEYYKRFIFELLKINYDHNEEIIELFYNPHDSSWRIDRTSYANYLAGLNATSVYGTSRASAFRLIEDCLNLRDTNIYDTVDEDGREKRVLNQAATLAAREKQNLIKEEFRNWIFADPERREKLEKRYNELFNQIRLPSYNGSYLKFPEMNPAIELRPHQKNAVHRIISSPGSTLLHHVVGSGKTFTMCASAMKLRQYGLAKKPMIVVPNHILQQFSNEFRQLYPNAKILMATKEDLEKENRKKFVSRVAMGDWDAVIIAQSSFAKIPISTERQTAKIQEEISRIELCITEQKAEKMSGGAVKNLERIKKSREAQLKKLMDADKKDDILIFESLGVDYLFIDEADCYKNLFLFTKMNNVAGISNAASQRATDLKLKCEYIQELHGGERGIVFATGTPISNSMTEMYTMQTYLQPETLKEAGIIYFDNWAADFGETVTALEMSPSGRGYKPRTRFSKFTNLPELLTMYRSFADVQTSDMVKLDVPEAEKEVVNLKPSDEVMEYADEIAARAEQIYRGGVDPTEDNMLKVTSDGKKLALDPRLYEDTAGDEVNSKINTCAEKIYEVWKDTAPQRGTQLVFCDLSTPKKAFADYEYGKDFDVYNELKYKLVQIGIPENEIAYIHEANSDKQKQSLFDNVNAGRVRVLIGSTEKCGAGTNVQQRIAALHHLDTPYRPRDLTQREGRAIRQGNTFEKVKIFTYVKERTFDSYSYQILENKQKFISQIDRGDLTVREAEDIDERTLTYAEIKAITAANPKIKRKMEVDMEVSRLRILEGEYRKKLYSLQDKVRKGYPEDIRRQKLLLERILEDKKLIAEKYNKENFSISVDGKVYKEKSDGGKELMDALFAHRVGEIVAEYGGLKINLNPIQILDKERSITLSGAGNYEIDIGESGIGLITRLDNFMADFPKREDRIRNKIAQLERDFEIAQEEIKQPFEHKDKLAELLKEQSELNIELNLNKREEIVIDDGDSNDTGDDGVHAKEVPVTLKRRARKHLNRTAISAYEKCRKETPESYIFFKNGNGYDLIDYRAEEVADSRGLKLINEVVDGKKYSVVPLTVEEMDEILKGGLEHGIASRIIEPMNYSLEDKKIAVENIDFKEFLDKGLSEIVWLNGRKSGYTADEISDLTYDLKSHYEGSPLDESSEEYPFDDWYDEFIEEKLKPFLTEHYMEKEREDYSRQTKHGYPIKARYKEDDREHIIFYRESVGDYAIGYGYNEESGDWVQGTYDIPDFLNAERELISNCTKPELVFRPQTEPLPFEHQTIEDGSVVYGIYKDGNMNLAIIRRLYGDYLLGIGYNAQTGMFEQGRYNFSEFSDAEKYINDNFPEAVKDENFKAEEPINYAELVKMSVENEYKNFYEYELSRTKEELINTDNYKIRFYNELSVFLGEDGRDYLNDVQYKALCKDSPNILFNLYDYYLGSEFASINSYSETAELIKDYNDKYHGDILYPNRQPQTVFYGKDDKDTAYYFLPSLTNEELSKIEEANNYVIVSPTNHVTPEHLDRYKTTFLKLGRDVTEIELKDMSRTVENLNIIAEQVKSDRLHTPIYYKDYEYAEAHGEEENYRFSKFLSVKCKDDIDKAISENYKGYSLDTNFIDGIIEKYGIERVAQVCASTINESIYDGRYSDKNREWAKRIPSSPETVTKDLHLSTHPAILDGFVNIIREKYNNPEEEKEMPEAAENNDNKPKWLSIKVSHNALIKQYDNYAFMRMPNDSEYAGYAYSMFNNRIYESRQLAGHELCYEFRMPETATIRLVKKGEEDINLTAQEFKKLVGSSTDKEYERTSQSDDDKKWYKIPIPQEAIRGEYEKSTLFAMPYSSEYRGNVFYVPSSMVREDKDKQDGSLILRIPNDFEITLLNREEEEENIVNGGELLDIFSGSTNEDFINEKDTGWRYVSVDNSAKIADYDERTMFRMPNDGNYAGSIYYIPARLLKENTKKGTFAVKLPPEFEVSLKTPENETVKLDVEEFMREVRGKKAESYDSSLQKPSEAAIKKFEVTESALRKNVPKEMLKRPNWVVVRTRKNFKSGRLDKFLINPQTGNFAESDNPETWADFDTACKFAKENGGTTLAYALDGKDNIACIDIDHCINENGEYSVVAKDALARCGQTYTETSVSGTGVHIFGKTNGADLRTFSKDGDMEYYRKAHFIAMTGNGVTAKNLKSFDNPDMQRMLEDKFEKRVECKSVGLGIDGLSVLSDREVLDKAFNSKSGEAIKRLYNGEDLKNNHSNSDMSLINYLTFWCHGDKEQILRIFATSGLYRPEKSADYYEGSIIKAIKYNAERYNPPKNTLNPPAKAGGSNGKA